MNVVARTAALLRPNTATRTVGPIGIDLALESVHLVQLEAAAGKPATVRARVSLPLDCTRQELLADPRKFRSLMKRALGADRFSGRQAVLALPPGMFRTVSINFPAAGNADQEAAAVLRVMKDRLDGELSDYVLDYLPVKSRSKSDDQLALVAVSERGPIVELLELARKARLDVQALEIGPVAISRLVCAMSAKQGPGNVLVVNSGRRVSYLTLISGSDLLFDQEVTFGEVSLIEQVAEILDLPADMARDLIMRTGVQPGKHADPVSEAIDESGLINTLSEIVKPQFLKLVAEIKRVFLYAAAETRGGSVAQVYLLGSIARWPGSDSLLSTLTGVNVATIPDPLALFPSGIARSAESTSQSAPEIAVATGLALRGMQGHG